MTTKSALCFMRLIPAFSRDALHNAERRYGSEDPAHTSPCGALPGTHSCPLSGVGDA